MGTSDGKGHRDRIALPVIRRNDIVEGGVGDDTIDGGSGDDTFIVEGSSQDGDVYNGGEGMDTILGGTGDDTVKLSQFDGSNSIEVIDGGAGTNIIAGNSSINNLDFSDTTLINISLIEGKGADDTIIGSAGDDVIEGDGGDDALYGGSGLDILWGQGGSDTFVFENASAFNNIDVIKDFSTSQDDAIDIAELLTAYDPMTDILSDFVQITDDGTDSTLAVDADGGADNFLTIATIEGITGLTDEQLMVDNNQLIV